MALTPEEQQLINKLLQEGIALARQLGDETSKASLENFTGDLNTAERLVHSLRDEWKKYTSDVEGTREGFTNVVSEIKKLTTGSKAASTAFSGLTSLAAKLQRHQENTSKLSSKELKDLQKQVQEKVSDLKLAGKLSKQEVKDLETKKASQGLSSKEQRQLEAARAAHANISQEITENMGFIKQFNDQLDDSVNRTENLEDAIGLGGNALKGMQGAMGKLGLEGLSKGLNMEDATSAMDDMASKLTNNGEKTASLGDKFKILGSGAKSAFSGLGKSLLGPEALIAEFVDALQKSDKAAGDLAKSFNITYSEALDTRRELSNMATLSGDVALNTKGLQESMVAVGKSLGTNAKLNDDDLKTFTKLREQAGYTNEELIGIQKLSLVNGKTLEDNTAEILGGAEAYAARNGFVVNEKDILKEVSAASASLKLTLGGSAEAVAKAAVQAKQFGLNLEQAEKISESLLQFETSIESELSAELLTGKNLNFERARALALEGKTAEAAAEVAKQVGTSRDFAKMNVIQQEALAKAAGMTRDELAQSLMDREALTKLSDVEGKDAKEKFNNLVKQVGLEEAKKRLGNEQLANQFAQQSVQERFAQATEKLKEVFISIAEPVLAIISPIVDLVTTILPAVNLLLQPLITGFQFIADTIGFISGGISMFAGWMKEGSAAATALKIVLAPIAAIVGVIAAGLIYASLAAIPVVGPALGAIAVVGMLAMLVKAATGAMSSSKKVADGVFPAIGGSGYGKRILTGPEGSIQLNNKDTVIAGTDLFKKGDDVMSAPKGTLNVSKGDDVMSASKSAITVANSRAPKPAPVDSNTLLAAQMKRSNDLKEQEMRRDRTVSTLRIQ